MKIYLLLLVFLFGANAYAQNLCCSGITAGSNSDTVLCKDTVRLHSGTLTECTVVCTTYGDPQNLNQDSIAGFTICGSQSDGDYAACGQLPFLIIAVIDSVCLTAWNNCNENFGQYNIYESNSCNANDFTYRNCRNRPEHYFEFLFPDSVSMTNAVNMLNTNVPKGDYLLVYTFESVDLSQYSHLTNTLQSLGSTIISTLRHVPYIFFVKKGYPNTAQEIAGTDSASIITLNANMTSSGSTSNIVYSWSPGSSLNDSTIQSPLAFPNATTTYYVTATDTFYHCSSVDSVTLNYNCASGINEISLSNEISISPNPSFGYFIVKSASLKLKRIFLINVIGQFVSETDADNASSLRVNTVALAEGIYFLQIETDQGILNKKVVVASK